MEAKDVTETTYEAESFAHRLQIFLEADATLKEAQGNVPNYTGQYSSEDYVATEQDARNMALNALWSMVSTGGPS